MTTLSFAKINIFLKITGTCGSYHMLLSRFMLLKDLFDSISFLPKTKNSSEFLLKGNFNCDLEQNSIYKAYKELLKTEHKEKIVKFFNSYFIEVDKNIPIGSGLGGGSSNAASFLLFCNEELELNLTKEKLSQIAIKIGSDLPFFIHEYNFANVEGVGEKVFCFEDKKLNLEVKTLPISCNTKSVYTHFRKNRLNEIDLKLAKELKGLKSEEILTNYSPFSLNDLFNSALALYPELNEHVKDGWFLSGSGSSLFRIKNV